MEQRIGLITATNVEKEAIRNTLTNRAEEAGPAGLIFETGLLGEVPVVTVKAGIGKVSAAMCTQALIDLYHPTQIINVGVAGALLPDIKISEIVIGTDLVQHDFDLHFFGVKIGHVPGLESREIAADERICEALRAACEAAGVESRFGRIVSGDQFITSDEKKQWLHNEFDAACTEMEGAAIAQVCLFNKVPFGVMRAISDGAGDGAGMQYDEFEKMAAERAADVLKAFNPIFE